MRRKQKNEKYLLPDIFLNRRQALRCIDHHRDQQNTIDLIDRIGPGGHYLNEDHTMRHFRKVWYPDLFDHTIYDDWQKQGAKRFEERLRKKTLKVMDHRPVPLPPEIIKELDKMEKHWE